jgi:hypothetical protein
MMFDDEERFCPCGDPLPPSKKGGRRKWCDKCRKDGSAEAHRRAGRAYYHKCKRRKNKIQDSRVLLSRISDEYLRLKLAGRIKKPSNEYNIFHDKQVYESDNHIK